MTQCHLSDVELAKLSGGTAADDLAGHVRSCARCRSVVADFDWLQGELAETLKSVVNEVSVPSPGWREVQGKLLESRCRQAVMAQVSALVSAAVVLSLLLFVPGFLKPATAGAGLQPGVALRPTPVAVAVPTGATGGFPLSGTSAGPALSRSVMRASLVPGVQALPTPPDPEP
jgi:hypothetical protein